MLKIEITFKTNKNKDTKTQRNKDNSVQIIERNRIINIVYPTIFTSK